MIELNAKTLSEGAILLSELDPEDSWFDEPTMERIALPGAPDPLMNTVTRKQARTIIRSQQRRMVELNYVTKTFAETTVAERRRMRLSPTQRDFRMVEKYLADASAESAHLPTTVDQQRMINDYISALVGKVPHWDEGAQREIVKLPAQRKEYFITEFLNVSTRGQLQLVLGRFEAFIGNIPLERARAANAATMQTGVNNPEINALSTKAKAKAAADEQLESEEPF